MVPYVILKKLENLSAFKQYFHTYAVGYVDVRFQSYIKIVNWELLKTIEFNENS